VPQYGETTLLNRLQFGFSSFQGSPTADGQFTNTTYCEPPASCPPSHTPFRPIMAAPLCPAPASTTSPPQRTYRPTKSTRRQNRPFFRVCTKDKCSQKPKEFKREGDWRMHVKRHDRPYQCNICTRAFYQTRDLNKHITTHAPGLSFTCPFQGCERTGFTRDYNLIRHLKDQHGIKVKKDQLSGPL
jgi:hypothetical protein